MSAIYSFSAPQSRQSCRLIACLLLLLISPFIEQAHVDTCENIACAICATQTGSELPALEAYAPIILQPAGIARPQATRCSNQVFCRHYDSRGSPYIS